MAERGDVLRRRVLAALDAETSRADAAEAEVARLREALKGASLGLLTLLSLIKSAHAKHHEPRLEMASDAMFERLLADNEARLGRARAALSPKEGSEG